LSHGLCRTRELDCLIGPVLAHFFFAYGFAEGPIDPARKLLLLFSTPTRLVMRVRSHLLEEQTMETTNGEKTVREAADNVQQAAEDLLSDAATQIGAQAKELREQARQLYADFTDVVQQATAERPFTALAIAAVVGFVLGALRSANRSRPD
jgi:ElaB/YqjD/DUF883 family membrane-anchored ribosome-binding protein